jgi:N-methylhydantoinase A
MRYIRQAYELSVPVKGGHLNKEDILSTAEGFHGLHERTYGYARRKEAVEFVNLRVVALGKLPEFHLKEEKIHSTKGPEPIDHREVFFEAESLKTSIYHRDHLFQGQQLLGPAIVEQMDSTIVIFPNYEAMSDRYGNLLIRKRGAK